MKKNTLKKCTNVKHMLTQVADITKAIKVAVADNDINRDGGVFYVQAIQALDGLNKTENLLSSYAIYINKSIATLDLEEAKA